MATSLCLDPSHAEPFACHCKAEGGWLCEGWDAALRLRAVVLDAADRLDGMHPLVADWLRREAL